MYKNIKALDYVFCNSGALVENQNITLKKIDMGELYLESGEIVAADPFVLFEIDSFKVTVPRGSYNVSIFIAEMAPISLPEPPEPKGLKKFFNKKKEKTVPVDAAPDKRVALACLKFSDKKAISWEMAMTGKEKFSDNMKDDSFFGYGVDSGTGGFMDKIIADKLSSYDDLYSEVSDEMDKTYEHTYSYILTNITKCGKNDFAAFSSGWGDGAYPSYFGFDEDGKPCVLVTDFMIIEK